VEKGRPSLSYVQIKRCLFASSVLPPWLRWRHCVRFLICYIFGRRPKGGAWPKWPNGKYATVGCDLIKLCDLC